MQIRELPSGVEVYCSSKLSDHLGLNHHLLNEKKDEEVSHYESSMDFFLNPKKIYLAKEGGLIFPKKLPMCGGCVDILTPDGYVVCEGKNSRDFLEEFVITNGDYHKKSNIEFDISYRFMDGSFYSEHVGPMEIGGSSCKSCIDIKLDKSKRKESWELIRSDFRRWEETIFSMIFPDHLTDYIKHRKQLVPRPL